MSVDPSKNVPGIPQSGGLDQLGSAIGEVLINIVNGVGAALSGAVAVGGAVLQVIFDGAVGLVTGVVNMVGNAIRRFWGGSSDPPVPLPDAFSPIEADLEGAMQPLFEKIDTALYDSGQAGQAADKAVDDLEALIDPDNEDSKLWQAQNAIDRLQNERDEYQDIAIAANRKATEALQQYITRVMFLPDSATVNSIQNPHWNVTFSSGKRRLTAKPGWVGEWIYHSAVHRSGDFGPVIEGGVVTAASRVFNLDTATSGASLQYTIRPGTPRLAKPPSVTGWVPTRDSWVNVPVSDTANSFLSGRFTAVTAGAHDIFIRVGWDATTRDDSYGVRVTRQLTSTSTVSVVKEIKQVGIGPLLPTQDGYRPQSIQVTLGLAVGERVVFQAWAGATGTDQRRMRNSEISVSWVDPPSNTSDVT